MRAIILAAGYGTRIASVANGLPKPLLSIGGEAVLVRNLRWLGSAGIRHAWINLHYGAEAIQRVVGDGSSWGVAVNYAYEPTILGTAGGVRNIAADWDDTFAVVYGDNLVAVDVDAMNDIHRRCSSQMTVALFDRATRADTDIAGGQVTIDARGRVLAFQEGVEIECSPLVNAGVYLMEPSAVRLIPAARFFDFGRDLFPRMLALRQPLYGAVVASYCLGLDSPQSYERALALIAKGWVKLQ